MVNTVKWRYYNYAMIPTTAPHEAPDETPISDGSIWKRGGIPILARWTTDFDCQQETEWWYIIKDTPFDINEYSSKRKKNIRYALNHCVVQQVNPCDCVEELYSVYSKAFQKYESDVDKRSYAAFKAAVQSETRDYWVAKDAENGNFVGFMSCIVHLDFVEISVSKFDPEHQNLRPSDALHYVVLEEYLVKQHKRYISSGSRNINHKTNVQEYKIENFGFRKAYCRLHVRFNPCLAWLFNFLYIFRTPLRKFDHNSLVHRINAVLELKTYCSHG